MKKIGMIFESGFKGADRKVCEYLASQIRTDLTLSSVALDNKPKLIENCGKVAAQLLLDGCQHVLIIWDLYPPWRDTKPCRKEDRDNILAGLKQAGVVSSKVHLICIQEELEAWLLADGRALSKMLSTAAHPHKIKIKGEKKPDRVQNPKGQLRKLFTTKIGRDYDDKLHAEKIVRCLPDLKEIERSESFQRFKTKLEQF